MKSICKLSFVLLLVSGFFFPSTAKAQCPSVMGTGDPAVILLNLYGLPHANYFAGAGEGLEMNVSGGLQLGAIFSPQFQLVSGVELTWNNRTIPNADPTSSLAYSYRTFFLEIPLEMRMRMHHSKKDETHFILGAGVMLANVRETNDPETTDDEMLFHQLFGRIGFEHTIQVQKTFNILWGLVGKVDPLGLINEEYSSLNGAYYGGLKLGIQLGL